MTNTAAATKRPADADTANTSEPSAKRPRNNVSRPSWTDLRPELIGRIALFLPMGTHDMMRLLFCVGPRVASIVRKMYLTGNDYYLDFYEGANTRKEISLSRTTEIFGYWMEHNEKAWKKCCLGKTHRENMHTISLTPVQAKAIDYEELATCAFFFKSKDIEGQSTVDTAALAHLRKLSKNSGDFVLVSVGTESVDDGKTTVEQVHSLIDTATLDGDGKLALYFMRGIDANFAYPQFVIEYDMVKALRFMIDEGIVNINLTFSCLVTDGYEHRSLLGHAFIYGCFECFCYLLSLPDTDVNAVAACAQYAEDEDEDRDCYNIIHLCVFNHDASLCFLEELLRCKDLDLDARDSFNKVAFHYAFERDISEENTATMIRMLLKAGADPREQYHGFSLLHFLKRRIKELDSDIFPAKKALSILKELRTEIKEKISELDESDRLAAAAAAAASASASDA